MSLGRMGLRRKDDRVKRIKVEGGRCGQEISRGKKQGTEKDVRGKIIDVKVRI